MIPVVFAMFVVVPPQIYFERIFNGVRYSSFLEFYPHVLELVPYPTGDFSWHHMWFVVYLFVYSVVCLPFFLFVKSDRGKRLVTQTENRLGAFKIVSIMLPTIIIGGFWSFWNPDTHDLIHDLPWHFYWCSFFTAGYLVGAVPSLWDTVELHRRKLLGFAMLSIVIINFFRWNQLEPWDIDGIHPAWEYLGTCILAANAWLWLLAASGYAKRYLNKHHPVLDYANRAIYPFYILHQTVIIAIGYYVIHVQESILAKYLFVSTLSLIGSLVIYEYLIRPYRLVRWLFGVKELKV